MKYVNEIENCCDSLCICSEKIVAKKLMIKAGLVIITPILLSYLILMIEKPLSTPTKNIVVVQPNIDPYNVKFATEYQPQFLKMLKLIEGKVSLKTDYLVLPETFVTGLHWAGVNENKIETAIISHLQHLCLESI